MSSNSLNSNFGNLEKLVEIMEKTAKERNAPVFTLKSFLKTPFQHLVFTVLSSRTKDEVTAEVCKRLFSKVDTPEKLAEMPVEEIEELIRGVGFYRVKAKRLKELAREIVKLGKIPDSFDELVRLPGVGRKTANVVLASAFKKPAIGVDTHVHRIANRLGLVSTNSVEETEEKLKELFPEEMWVRVNRAMVGFGQTVCKPQKPQCDVCPLKEMCKYNCNFRKSRSKS